MMFQEPDRLKGEGGNGRWATYTRGNSGISLKLPDVNRSWSSGLSPTADLHLPLLRPVSPLQRNLAAEPQSKPVACAAMKGTTAPPALDPLRPSSPLWDGTGTSDWERQHQRKKTHAQTQRKQEDATHSSQTRWDVILWPWKSRRPGGG